MVRCRIAMPEVVSSNPGQGKINLQKVMGSDGKIVNIYPCSVCPMLSMRSVMVSDCII